MPTIGDLKARDFIGYSITCRWCSNVSARPWTGLQNDMPFEEIARRGRFRCTRCRYRDEVIVFPRLAWMKLLPMSQDEAIGTLIWAGLGWNKRRR